MPQIDLTINTKLVDVVIQRLSENGYTIADKLLLSNSNDSVDIILGGNCLHLVEFSSMNIGSQEPSVLIDTPFGVMLIGDIDNLVKNLDCLPKIYDKNCEGDNISDKETTAAVANCLFTESIANSKLNVEPNIDSKTVTVAGRSGDDFYPKNLEIENIAFAATYEIDSDSAFKFQLANDNSLNSEYSKCLNFDPEEKIIFDETIDTETNIKCAQYVLDNITRDDTGRIFLPLLWNNKISHLLGKNFNLAKQILASNVKKLKKHEGHLLEVDKVFKEQESLGIIEKVKNLNEFLEKTLCHSFLPHMAVVKPDRETTKFRVVFLSNLKENDKSMPATFSHNQAMMPGPSLNHKIITSLMLLRFDKYVLIFDIKKAFLNIGLSELDKNKLLFLWYKNVEKGDFDLIAYRNCRLSYGLKCSPFLLMMALFKVLIVDAEGDELKLRYLKKLIFSLMYMDNGSVTFDNEKDLNWAFQQLSTIFEPYSFYLQQFVTNSSVLQNKIDVKDKVSTPDSCKLLGMQWNRVDDKIGPKPINLNANADTKRLVLQTINAVYDVFGFFIPILN